MAKHEICEMAFEPTKGYIDGVSEFGGITGWIPPENRDVVIEAAYATPGENLDQLASSGFNKVYDTLRDRGALLKAVALHLITPDDNNAPLAEACAMQARHRDVAILDYSWDNVGSQITTPFLAVTGLGVIPSGSAKNVQRSCVSLNTSQISVAGALEGSIAGDPKPIAQPQMTFYNLNEGEEGPALSAFNPRGRVVVMNARSLGKKAAWYTINDNFRAAGSDVCALVDHNLEQGIDPRALVALTHFSGDRRFVEMETSLERLAEQQKMLTRMVYSDHPEILQGFYKKGPMCHVGACVISIYDPAADTGAKRFRPLYRGHHVYAVGVDNPRLAGLDLHEQTLRAMHGDRSWPKSKHAKWMLKNFLTQPSVVLMPYLRQLKADGIIGGVFIPNGDGSALQRFGQALHDKDLHVVASDLYEPNSIEQHMLEFACDNGIMTPHDGRAKWTFGTGAILTSRNGRLEKQTELPIRHIGQIDTNKGGKRGLYVTIDGKEHCFP
jgi:hypothetical protein